jgi:drug/metabolite transporter (DMT)-like permease
MKLDARTAALLILPPVLWAGNAVVGRALVGLVPPLALSFLRWSLAGLILLPFVWNGVRRHAPQLRARWRDVVLMGVLGVGAYNSFQYLALQTSTPINVTLIAASTPVFALAVGALFFGERVRAAQWTGAALSIAGVLWVLARGELARLAAFTVAPGDLIMLLANFTWTVYTWLLRTRRPDVPLGPLLGVQIGVGALAIAPLAAAEAALGATFTWNATSLAGLAYVAVLPSIVAYYCWDRGVAHAGAVLPMYFVNLTPLFAALLSTLLLGEAPHLFHVVGLVLILAGIQLASRPAPQPQER